jgi:hypothetical protein
LPQATLAMYQKGAYYSGVKVLIFSLQHWKTFLVSPANLRLP